jgi:hypothetical protein
MCGKERLKFKNSGSILESSLNFSSFKIPHILRYECFFNVANRSSSSLFPPSNEFYYMNPFDSLLQN